MKQADKNWNYSKKPTSGYFYIPGDIKNHNSDYSWSRKCEIENCKIYHSEGIKMEEEARIEVSPKYGYRIGD